MAEKTPQNFANHTRWNPLFHFFVLPVFAITWVSCVVFSGAPSRNSFGMDGRHNDRGTDCRHQNPDVRS